MSASVLDWPALADRLEIDAPGDGLPATAECPLCRRHTLRVSDGEPRPGSDLFLYCRNCGRNGDAVDWLAAVRDENRGAAEASLDLSPAASARLADRLRRRGEAEAMHSLAAAATGTGEDALASAIGLRADLLPDLWRSAMSPCVGFVATDAVRQFLGGKPRGGNAESAVLTCHREAGRVSGFVFVEVSQRGGIRETLARAGDSGSCGLFGLPWFERRAGAVLLDSPLAAVRLQCLSLRASGGTLPIGAWVSGRRSRRTADGDWLQASASGSTLWAESLTPPVLWHAIQSGFPLSISPRPDAVAGGGWDSADPLALPSLLDRVRRTAAPWPPLLAALVRSRSRGELEAFLDEFRTYGGDPASLVDEVLRCDTEAGVRICGSIAGCGPPLRSIAYRGMRITEHPDGWKAKGRRGPPGFVSNFHLKLLRRDRAKIRGRFRDTYTAEVRYAGRPLRLSLPAEPKAACAEIYKLPYPLEVGESWRMRLLEIALRFDPLPD